jgi:hypothetical protein
MLVHIGAKQPMPQTGLPHAGRHCHLAAASRRDRSVQARRKAREAKADRERQIVNLLNRRLSVAEIASRSGVSVMAERIPHPPGEFLALQVSRLNDALLLSYSAMHNSMTGTNFEAVDRVVRYFL